MSEVELGEGEGPQVNALLPDLGLKLLPELVFHNDAQVGPDVGDDLGGQEEALLVRSVPPPQTHSCLKLLGSEHGHLLSNHRLC